MYQQACALNKKPRSRILQSFTHMSSPTDFTRSVAEWFLRSSTYICTLYSTLRKAKSNQYTFNSQLSINSAHATISKAFLKFLHIVHGFSTGSFCCFLVLSLARQSEQCPKMISIVAGKRERWGRKGKSLSNNDAVKSPMNFLVSQASHLDHNPRAIFIAELFS